MTVLLFLQFLTRLTERFVLGVDMFVETLWKFWTELLDVLGLDGKWGWGRIHLRLFFSSGSQDVDSVSAVGGMGDFLEGAGGHK